MWILFKTHTPIGPHPRCHIALNMLLERCTEKDPVYPNVEGSSRKSLALLGDAAERLGLAGYGYVPGLRRDDGVDLVLFYLKRRTRYRWHYDRPPVWVSLGRKPRWMVIPPAWHKRVDDPLRDPDINPEGGYLLDTDAFKRALKRTLEFLEKNDRPHWRQTVREHQAFLQTLE
jgi:hypothetical protein